MAARSPAGHFAPSVPLQLGVNRIAVRSGEEVREFAVTRLPATLPAPESGFAPGSLQPARDIARLPGEAICLEAIAAPGSQVRARLGGFEIPLQPQPDWQLPPNAAILTGNNAPLPAAPRYVGCLQANAPGPLGQPEFRARRDGQTVVQVGPGRVEILEPLVRRVVEVTAEAGVARTGPSTDHSRLTPLPQGTRAIATGTEGEWLRLGYGGWIRAEETRDLPDAPPPETAIRSLAARQIAGATEVRIPLQVPVPIAIAQADDTLTLTLHNSTAQTDTIRFDPDPLVRRLDWEQRAPGVVDYHFRLRAARQWGYAVRYEGTTLVLALRHPPTSTGSLPLSGVSVLLDPGHGGEELGARGPTGYPEKSVNLTVSKLLRDELVARGAQVSMTREDDRDVSLGDRAARIAEEQPTLALSIHYNALPDDGDAEETAGIGTFWYHPQAHDLAVYLHDRLTRDLNRPSYGVFWNNLALTRPHAAPTVLLELGFMIHPEEFEWIVDPAAQRELARAIADAIADWHVRTHT